MIGIRHGTHAWFQARLGKPTASQIWRIMDGTTKYRLRVRENGEWNVLSSHLTFDAAKKKAGKRENYEIVTDREGTAERQSYMVELLTERLTGSVIEHHTTAAMEHGMIMEPLAIQAYEMKTGAFVEKCGEKQEWIDVGGRWGATPDGLVDDDGMIEVKCPTTKTFVRQALFDDDIPKKHYWQMQAQMAATDRNWCDYILFDDRIRDHKMTLQIQRVDRDPNDCIDLRSNLINFCNELDAKEREFRNSAPGRLLAESADAGEPAPSPSSENGSPAPITDPGILL